MFRILQARLQQYLSKDITDVQAGFQRGREKERSNCHNSLDHEEIKGVPEKNIYFCFIDYVKAFDCMDHKKLWKILKMMGIPDHRNFFLKNLYGGQEATVRTGHGTTD